MRGVTRWLILSSFSRSRSPSGWLQRLTQERSRLEGLYPWLEVGPEWVIHPVRDVGECGRHVDFDQLRRFREVPSQVLKPLVAHVCPLREFLRVGDDCLFLVRIEIRIFAMQQMTRLLLGTAGGLDQASSVAPSID